MNMFANDQGVPTPGPTQAGPRRNMFADDAPAATVMQPAPQGAADPYHARAAQYLDNLEAQGKTSTGGALNTFLHGATSGVANRLIAGGHALVGQALAHDGLSFPERMKYELALEQEKYRRASQGTGGTIGEIAGGFINPMNKIPGGLVANGAAQGGVTGLMDTGTASGAATGSALGAGGGVAGKALGGVVGKTLAAVNPAPRVAPAASADALQKQAQALYKNFENSGGRFSSAGLDDLSNLLNSNLRNKANYVPGSNDTVTRLLGHVDDWRQPQNAGDVLPTDMQWLSQGGGLSTDMNPSVRRLGYNIEDTVNDWMSNASHANGHIQAGGSVDVASKEAADKLWRQASKAKALEGHLDKQQRAAAVSGVGGNTVNNNRRAINNTYNQLTKRGSKLTPDEEGAFRTAINGSTAENAMRAISRLGIRNNGLINAVHLGLASTLGPGYAVVPAIGALADMAANKMATRNADEVGRVIRNGGVRKSMPQAPTAAQRRFNSDVAPRLAGPFAQIFSSQLNPAPVRNSK